MMIKATVYEATKHDPLKRVYFTNSKRVVRESFYDKSNNLILDEMKDFDALQGITRSVLFSGNNYEIIAYQDMFHTDANQRSDQRVGCTNYKLIDGQFRRISHNIYEAPSEEYQFSQTMFYDQNGKLVYYIIDDTTRIFENIRITTYFDHNGEEIKDYDTFFVDKILKVETYDSIKSDLLQQARNKYNNPQ